MSGKSVIKLKDVAIYHAEDPFVELSAAELKRKGHLVLSDVNLSVEEGEFVYLIGRVGSGKVLYSKLYMLNCNLLKAREK